MSYADTYRRSQRWRVKIHNGTPATMRPIRPEDAPLLVDFHRALSDHSVSLRYARHLDLSQRLAREREACRSSEVTLVVERKDPKTGTAELIGLGHLTNVPGTNDVELDMIIRDDHQGQGLGTALFERLIQVGKERGRERMVANMLTQHQAMRRLLHKFGFQIAPNEDPGDPMVKAVKVLGRSNYNRKNPEGLPDA